MKDYKVYVDVVASFNSDGELLPKSLTWEDGREFEIDRVTDVRQAAAAKAGSQGDRYTIFIDGLQKYLYFERNASRTVYIPIALHHVHGVLEPLSRKMRTTFTETVPLHDLHL